MLGISSQVFTFSGMGFGDSTGSPPPKGVLFQRTSCNVSGCHTGNPTSEPTWSQSITSNIPTTGYVAGKTYTFTINLGFPGIDAYGFQAMVWGIDDSISVGTISPSNEDVSRVQISSNAIFKNSSNIGTNFYATHRLNGLLTTTVGSTKFSFNWKAPTNIAKNKSVYVYVGALAANGNGAITGDRYTTFNQKFDLDLNTPPDLGTSSLENQENKTEVNIFPNPAQNMIQLSSKQIDFAHSVVSVYDVNHKLVKTIQPFNPNSESMQFDVSDFQSGVYITEIKNTLDAKAIKLKWVKE